MRVACKPFHLSGVSPTSTVEDVVTFCRLKRVNITGCYPVHTRVWGTQSMKVFVERSAEEVILSKDFWPEHVSCRKWLKNPKFGSHGPSVRNFPEI